MNFDEKELQKLLNREKIERVELCGCEIIITTEDKEIVLISSSLIHLEIKDKEIVE